MIPLDWIAGLVGGLMIGGAAALFLLMNSKIMGASGLLGGLIDGSGRANAAERIALLDALRGFALLGILLMNIEYFQRPLQAIMLASSFGLPCCPCLQRPRPLTSRAPHTPRRNSRRSV